MNRDDTQTQTIAVHVDHAVWLLVAVKPVCSKGSLLVCDDGEHEQHHEKLATAAYRWDENRIQQSTQFVVSIRGVPVGVDQRC